MEQSKILQTMAKFAEEPGEVTGKLLTKCNPMKLCTE